ncbi:MAG: M1 family aminopeptidase [Pseudomonadota bacterium]
MYDATLRGPHLALSLMLITTGLAASDRAAHIPVEPGVSLELARHRASLISELEYGLELSIPRDAAEDIPGRISIDFLLDDASQPLQVDFRESADHLRSATINGREADLEFTAEHIVIPSELLNSGANTLHFEFVAGSTSLNRNPDFLYTLFVPDRARTAFPVFDQPDLKARWNLSLDVPEDWTAISSAPALETEQTGERKRIRFGTSERLSTYLFSFAAGSFQTVTRDIGDRAMTVVHRETDAAKVARNIDDIYALHAAAVAWLEDYTGISFPYQKLDIALLPAHPYGGMEHVGAIQYRAESLWLDEGASDTQLLGRASLIAHEVAHMWFGNLVTMRWFDDVWTKEVFANFMAAKIVNPSFPAIDHDLNFLARHHPRAYAVDRSAGANPIRQPLGNLNLAGQLYGAIIYNKAPIMMRQLELLLGETAFRDGLREYLRRFSHANASWPELIAILDRESDEDLKTWSETWVNSAGRPHFQLLREQNRGLVEQRDPEGAGRLWPQRFTIEPVPPGTQAPVPHEVTRSSIALDAKLAPAEEGLLFNARGYGYGLFPASLATLSHWQDLEPAGLASLLINLNEQMLETGQPVPAAYLEALRDIVMATTNQLLLDLAFDQLRHIYWTLIPDDLRSRLAPGLEAQLWKALDQSDTESLRKVYFDVLADISVTAPGLMRLKAIWAGDLVVDRLPLSERELVALTIELAIKLPASAEVLLGEQRQRTKNPDERRRLAFLMAPLSADVSTRDRFFASLAEVQNRETESWVLDALAILHHPLRHRDSERYILPSLELLEEIQATGDIFFPTGWLRSTLDHHSSDEAVETVQTFLERRPGYNAQLRMKLLQAADPMLRANRLRDRATPARDGAIP